VAREPIVAGEEITFDYAMRNYSVEHFPGGCLCGSDTCRGSITGWRDLSDERKAAYRGLVAPYPSRSTERQDPRRKSNCGSARPLEERDEGFAVVS
jgi:hypothetical protein